MPRLRVPSVLQVSLVALASCGPSQPPPDASDVVADVGTDAVAIDAPPDDVPLECDSMPFVGYCLPTQASAGTVCRPSRACDTAGCGAGCSYCAFPIECHRTDGTYCLTTCSESQCPPDCTLIA